MQQNTRYKIHHFEDENLIKTCNDKQSFFLKRATNLALKSPCQNHRHGCVIVKDDEILSEGYNHTQTHLYHKFSIHAEVDAISKLKHNKKLLSSCDLYVVRIGRDSMGNPLKYSKPCQDCIKAIHKAGIRRVYYSSNLEFERLLVEKELAELACDYTSDSSGAVSDSSSSTSYAS
jgi:deoxycytidylate deaminase